MKESGKKLHLVGAGVAGEDYQGREDARKRSRRLREQLSLIATLERRNWTLGQIAHEAGVGYDTARRWKAAGESANPTVAFEKNLALLREAVRTYKQPPAELVVPRGGPWLAKDAEPTELERAWGLDVPAARAALFAALLQKPGLNKSRVCKHLPLRRATLNAYLIPTQVRRIPPAMVPRMVAMFEEQGLRPAGAAKSAMAA